MHACSCKEEPPSEGKVMANILKERQYAVHEALASAVNEAKATYENMKVRPVHCEEHWWSSLGGWGPA